MSVNPASSNQEPSPGDNDPAGKKWTEPPQVGLNFAEEAIDEEFDDEDFDEEFDDDFEEEVEGEYDLEDDQYGEEFNEEFGHLTESQDEDDGSGGKDSAGKDSAGK